MLVKNGLARAKARIIQHHAAVSASFQFTNQGFNRWIDGSKSYSLYELLRLDYVDGINISQARQNDVSQSLERRIVVERTGQQLAGLAQKFEALPACFALLAG